MTGWWTYCRNCARCERPCRSPCRGWWARRLQSPACCSACLREHRVCRRVSRPCRSRPCLRRSLATTSCFVGPSCRGPKTHQSPICECRRRAYMASARVKVWKSENKGERRDKSCCPGKTMTWFLVHDRFVMHMHRPATLLVLLFRRVPHFHAFLPRAFLLIQTPACQGPEFQSNFPAFHRTQSSASLSASVVLLSLCQVNFVFLTLIWPPARPICTTTVCWRRCLCCLSPPGLRHELVSSSGSPSSITQSPYANTQ